MNDPLESALQELPHGPQFRFIDRLLALLPGESASAEYTVRGDEPFLAGHFPGDPLFPGVLLVEAGAQLAGIVAQSERLPGQPRRLRLTAVRAVKILGAPRPGETVQLEARVLQRLGNLVQAEVRVSLLGAPLLQGEVTLSGES